MSLTELCTELFRQDVPFIDTPWVWSLRWNPTRDRNEEREIPETPVDDGRVFSPEPANQGR